MTISPMTLPSQCVRGGLFILLVILAQQPYAGQLAWEGDLVIQNWDTEEGLPSSSVTSIVKTPDGYLWIGTFNGLARYDGHHFKTMYPCNRSAVSDSVVTALLADRTGTLWVGTQNGLLLKVAGNTFSAVPLHTNAQNAAINGLVEDRGGAIWGTFDRAGVFRYQDARLTWYGTNSGLPWEMVWGITVDRKGCVWVVSRGQLMYFHDSRWHRAEGLPEDFPRVSAVAASSDGGLWLACVAQTGPPAGDRGTKIYKLRDGQLIEDTISVPWSQDSRRSLARFLLEDRQGRLWCGTRGAGVFVREKTGWRLLSEAPSLCQPQTTCIAQDEDQNIWLGMDGTGLFRVRPRMVAALEPPGSCPPACFWTVVVGRDGSIWGGTDGNGIFRWHGGTVTHFGKRDGLANEHVNAIIEDRTGTMWAGTMGGLFVYRGHSFEQVKGVPALELPVFALKEDSSGRLWVGTRNGLLEIAPGTTNLYGQEHGIPFGAINAIEEDRLGRIWVSIPPFRDPRAPGPPGPHGLFVLSGGRFEHVAAGGWAGEKSIRCLLADELGNLWIGTVGAGLFKLSNGQITEFSREHGLPNNRIQAIIQDDAGNLWFCSELGVFGAPLDRLANTRPAQFTPLSWWRLARADGLPNKAATGNGQPCAWRGPDGRIWFANGNAIAGFDPRVVTRTAQLNPPIIEEVLVNGLEQSQPPEGRLRIGTGPRRIEIRYSAPNITTPDLPVFWVRLEGFDKEWVYTGGSRVAAYNLQPGNYKFSVAVTGPDGARLEAAKPLQIEIIPTFWERTSVRVIVGTLLVGAIATSVWRWERARSERRVRQLEIQRAMDMVRHRIARDIHDELGSGLTEITLLCDNLSADGNDPVTTQQTALRIAKRARCLTHQIDEVVWAINPQTDTLESFVTYLNEYAQEQLATAGIRCRLNTPPELPNVRLPTDVRHSLFRAAKEALNNSIKHAHPTEVAITVELRGSDLVVVIQDNGCGFDVRQQFGCGNGLRNIRQRLEEIGGSSSVQSTVGSGTVVSFTIPIHADDNNTVQTKPASHTI